MNMKAAAAVHSLIRPPRSRGSRPRNSKAWRSTTGTASTARLAVVSSAPPTKTDPMARMLKWMTLRMSWSSAR